MEETTVVSTGGVRERSLVPTILLTTLIAGIIFGFLGYFLRDSRVEKCVCDRSQASDSEQNDLGENKDIEEDTSVEPVPVSICIKEREKIEALVNNFENLQKAQDAEGVLALFTPAVAKQDIEDYNYLTGKDTNVPMRLYSNGSLRYGTESFKLLTEPKEQGVNCIVEVEEMRSNYGGAADPTYGPSKAFKFQIEAKRSTGNWMIESYDSLDSLFKDGKYSGFLMVYR